MDKDQVRIDFDNFEVSHWPNNEKFPINLNNPGENRTVDKEVTKDIDNSSDYLIITGFTSLSNIIDKFGTVNRPTLKKVRIVLGWEPNKHGRKRYPLVRLKRDIKEYWLKEGLSIIQGGAVIQLIELIQNKTIAFRFRDKLHAKLYVGNHNAILGSANFSISGLKKQEEANIRVAKEECGETESFQYQAITSIAEKFFQLATPYNDELIELLKNLIQQVTWEEALARAISEVVEGDWLSSYVQLFSELNKTKLWPTQWKGIAQAMIIIQNQSNVLIADPTGAGKTKFASALMLTLVHWLWENGKQDRTNSLIICPPLVINNWRNEFRALSRVDYSQISMWLFSNAGKKKMAEAANDVDLANIITLDEAHNYLNPDSKRSKAIQHRKADHTLLVTATPMNKKADDLLRLIELLDVDNLSDEDFKRFKLLREKKRKLDKNDLSSLKSFISHFLVRRTKAELNKEIDKEPEKYLNKEGKQCRFPIQLCPTYKTGETKRDIEIAIQIADLAQKLKGVIYLRSILRPDWELASEEEEQIYIDRRIRAANALCGYMIKASLRSSSAALLEHVAGSDEAKEHFGFDSKKNKTGNQIAKIESFKHKVPRKSFKHSLFPKWLVDKNEYLKICNEEINIYKKIGTHAKRLSGQRELSKAKHLLRLQRKHKLIVAFDSTVITLDYLNFLLMNQNTNSKVYVVSGNTATVRNEVMEIFKLGSTSKNCIALCSDQMSEGANLQQASAVVL
ncbi:MAG: SNF2-related protein [Bacteroidota bacterium]